MSFQITTQPFGPLASASTPLTEYSIRHTETGAGFTVLPGFGGVLRRLVLPVANDTANDQPRLFSLLETPDSPQALQADETYASALLYPFPSRIRHGIYAFAGQEYALPFNDFGRNNAIHGFIHPRPFVVIGQEVTDTEAAITLRYDYPGDLKGYPFLFSLTVRYALYLTNGESVAFSISFEVANTGLSRCPSAFGWHPYFTLTNGTDDAASVDDLTLAIPATETVLLDDNLLPVGQIPFTNSGPFSLTDRRFDAVFVVDNRNPVAETVLSAPTQNVSLVLTQDTAVFPFLVVYTPERRDRIAIEPITANVNAFNTGEGLRVLEPGEHWGGTISVRLATHSL
jgi:aldose 1-epimerase